MSRKKHSMNPKYFKEPEHLFFVYFRLFDSNFNRKRTALGPRQSANRLNIEAGFFYDNRAKSPVFLC